MMNGLKKVVFILLASILLLGGFSDPAHAVWHALLNEDFNKDQSNRNLLWPWITDQRVPLWWLWIPRNPYRRAEGDVRSNFCWGLQDHIFNSNVTRNTPFQQSLWCAYTNQNDVNNPRWPEDDDYENNQNAWVWWGPVSLEEAVSANVSAIVRYVFGRAVEYCILFAVAAYGGEGGGIGTP